MDVVCLRKEGASMEDVGVRAPGGRAVRAPGVRAPRGHREGLLSHG
jgi:hypothetical protein